MNARAPAIPAATIAGLLLFVLIVAVSTVRYIYERGMEPASVAASYAAFILLLIPYLGFGYPPVAQAFRALGERGAAGIALVWAILVVPCTVALLNTQGTAGALPAAGLLLYAAAPLAILAAANRFGPQPNLLDAVAVLAAWMPMERGLLSDLWSTGSGPDPSYVLGKTLSVSVLLAGYIVVRPLGGIGYRWRLRPLDAGAYLVSSAAFLAVAIPAALATGFVTWDPRPTSLYGIATRFLAIGLFIALPEELLYRGVIFNLLQKATMGRWGPYPALALSAVIFGLSHLNNFPLGDWRYVVIATWAGVCYGWAYLRSGSLLPGILTHATVDVLHRLVFITHIQQG